MITDLKPNQIFVFGSNLAGHHLGGAARQAFENFGAAWGIGEGLTGNCYAFPTLDKDFRRRTINNLWDSVRKLYKCCRENPGKDFMLTRVGCGIAGAPYPGTLLRPDADSAVADRLLSLHLVALHLNAQLG